MCIFGIRLDTPQPLGPRDDPVHVQIHQQPQHAGDRRVVQAFEGLVQQQPSAGGPRSSASLTPLIAPVERRRRRRETVVTYDTSRVSPEDSWRIRRVLCFPSGPASATRTVNVYHDR